MSTSSQSQPTSSLGGGGAGQSSRVDNGSRLAWSQRSATTSSTSQSVKAALRESTTKRLRLIRSPLGGGLVPSNDDSTPPPQQSDSSSSNNNSSGSSSSESPLLNVNRVTPSSTSSLGGGSIDRLSSTRFKKECDIAHILPVTDVKRMARSHWTDIYSLERRYLPMDWYPPKESAILGVKQCNINRDHRHRIVKWMGEACGLFHWTTQTFFTAVHAWDVYMTVAPHEVTTSDLAKLSAACLYFGAQLVESAADENVKPLEEFTELCPEVGSTTALREIQAHVVDTLQGISLVRRTPIDFLLLFLAQMQIAPSPCPELFESLLHQNLLDVLWDLVLAVSLATCANGLVLDGLPGSRWVAGSMLRVLEFACPALRTDTNAREIIRRHVFHLPAGALETHQTTILDPIIKAVWQLIVEAATNDGSSGSGEGGRQDPQSSRDASSSPKKSMPYHIIRHQLPPSFPQWPITFPSNRIVQDVSARLRAASFETCTPPNVYATGPSISASKRAGEKSRRHSSTSAPLPNGGLVGDVGVGFRAKENTSTDENAAPGRPSVEVQHNR